MKELCSKCGKSVACGSGKFVNRIIDLDSIMERKLAGRLYPEGDYICAECEDEYYNDLRGNV